MRRGFVIVDKARFARAVFVALALAFLLGAALANATPFFTVTFWKEVIADRLDAVQAWFNYWF